MSNSVEQKGKSFQKTFYLICSYGQEESGSDYAAKKFLREGRKVFAQRPKGTKNAFFNENHF